MGSEILKYFQFTNPVKRQRMNFGHNRPEIQGIEIGQRGGNIHTLLAIGDIKEVPAPNPSKSLAAEAPRPEPLPVPPIIHEVEEEDEAPKRHVGRPRKDHK